MRKLKKQKQNSLSLNITLEQFQLDNSVHKGHDLATVILFAMVNRNYAGIKQ